MTQQNETAGYQKLKDIWEANWSRPDYKPSWIITKIPAELKDTVAEGWFEPHKSLLDIGCGTGELAYWLAQQGFKVTGCDLSASVIERAKTTYQDTPDLNFKVIDICQDLAPDPQFEILFDRACLHGLPKGLYGAYAQVVASWALPGAKFLLMCGVNQGQRKTDSVENQLRTDMINHLQTVFKPFFTYVKAESIYLERRPPRDPAPAIAIWFVRNIWR